MSLVLDLSRVEFVPSLALGLLVKIHKSLVQAGKKCVLVGVRPQVQESMSVTGLTKLLVLCLNTRRKKPWDPSSITDYKSLPGDSLR